MHLILRNDWHNERRSKSIVPLLLCFLTVSLFVWPAPSFDYTFDQVIESFERDFDRVNPIKMRGRFQSIVSSITGMGIGQDVRIAFKQRGDVKHELFLQDMKKQSLTDEYKIAAYEYVLKQLRFIEQDHSLKDILLGSLYDNLYGFYEPSTKQLVIMEGTSKQIARNILFHELVHAAQDRAIDLSQYYGRHAKNLDSGLAASALVEGQATAVELLVQIEQNLQDKTRREILEIVLAQMGNAVCYPEAEERDFLALLNAFPYSFGLRFVLERYLNDTEDFTRMFENVPSSTEQILHPEKFHKNEKPVKTTLQKKKGALSALRDTQLLLETTLGEYFIREMLPNILKAETSGNQKAALGWGGDTMFVLKSSGGLFFVWDTEWDSSDDAERFHEAYRAFSQKRCGVKRLHRHETFEAILSKDQPRILLKRKGRRASVIEGNVPASTLKPLKDLLGL